jgi:hypothetical protein
MNGKHRIYMASSILLFLSPGLFGQQTPPSANPAPQAAETAPAEPMSRREKRKQRRAETGGGMAAGALAGAALGALVGEAGYGAAMGAAVGGAYTYDQQRKDERMEILAGAVAQPNVVVVQQEGPQQSAPAQFTVAELGRQNLASFTGDWDVEIWAMTGDGGQLNGTGTAKGIAAGDTGARIMFTQVEIEGFEEAAGGGQVVMSYAPGKGFFLESDFSFADEILNMVGEYLPESGVYNFYLPGSSGENATGVVRSSVRVEIRSSGDAMWSAKTHTFLDGKEVQVQSYRMIRRDLNSA